MSNNEIESGQLLFPRKSSVNLALLDAPQNVCQDLRDLRIRVLIVDDLKLVYEEIKAIFAEDQNIEIVGFALNGQEALDQIDEIQPDVVVLDMLMPVMGGLEATQKITKQHPNVKILILSASDDDSIVSEVIAAGANGYVLKNMITSELALAIHSVHMGSCYFATGILHSLAKITAQNLNSEAFDLASQVVKDQAQTTKSQVAQPPVVPAKKNKQPKPEKPLFPYGDWVLVGTGVIVLSQINGAGHDLGHTGLFLLMLALIARPIKSWWSAPLQYRRGIGIVAFAATLAHAIYATNHFLQGNWASLALIFDQYAFGLWAGILALAIMTPAAVTSFQFMQRKLGKTWRKIHLLTLPAMALAVLHTVLVGPDYLMTDSPLELAEGLRTYGIIFAGILIFLLRKQIIWSKFKLNNLGKLFKKSIKA
jgi:DNA-binding NarL/FixJ family response regulator/DMSO/TMAO reductase YedYZ heme-binding membrane subunit